MKNRKIAAFMAIVFGWLGFHKFYLGKWVQGILYIIFMPVALFIGPLEGILYLCNSQEDFDINYNADYLKRKDYLKNREN